MRLEAVRKALRAGFQLRAWREGDGRRFAAVSSLGTEVYSERRFRECAVHGAADLAKALVLVNNELIDWDLPFSHRRHKEPWFHYETLPVLVSLNEWLADWRHAIEAQADRRGVCVELEDHWGSVSEEIARRVFETGKTERWESKGWAFETYKVKPGKGLNSDNEVATRMVSEPKPPQGSFDPTFPCDHMFPFAKVGRGRTLFEAAEAALVAEARYTRGGAHLVTAS